MPSTARESRSVAGCSSSKESESLAYFKHATGATCEKTAKHLLEASQGDANTAVELFFSTMQLSNKPTSSKQKAAAISHGLIGSEAHEATLQAAAQARKSEFEEPQPPIYLCKKAGKRYSLVEALEMSSREAKWLLLHIQRAKDFKSYEINRDIWKNDVVVSIVESCFCFWMDIVQMSMNHVEYYTHSQKNGKVWRKIVVKEVPSFLVVNPFSKEVEWESVVHDISPDALIENLIQFVDRQPKKNLLNVGSIPFQSAEERRGKREDQEDRNENRRNDEFQEFTLQFRFPNGLVLSNKFYASATVRDLYNFAANTKVSRRQFEQGKKLRLKYIFQYITNLERMDMTIEEAEVKGKVIIVTYQ